MSLFSKSLIGLLVLVVAGLTPATASAQKLTNTVDFELTPIFACQNLDPNDPFEALICNTFLPFVIEDLMEAEEFLDQVFVGYRDDIPLFLRNQINEEPMLINCELIDLGGPGDVLAVGGQFDVNGDGLLNEPEILSLIPPAFLQTRRYRAWSIPKFGTMQIDLNDIPGLVLTDTLTSVVIHEAFHAMGHPNTFEISNLNTQSNIFGPVNFVGDAAGINGIGHGLTEFRLEGANPLAEFVPLSQADGSAHLSLFEPAFLNFDDGLQEVFLPFELGLTSYMSRTLRGMFADIGYKVVGVNVPGLIDIDQDGKDDVPLIVDPELPGEQLFAVYTR